MLIVALAIMLESAGPVLDRQTCIGRGGRRFQMLKFRALVHDPERTRPVWAGRPTQIGHLLRYPRIEDLPQLLKVLRGEMSLIDAAERSTSFSRLTRPN